MEFDKDFLRVKGEGKEIIGVIRPVLAGFVLPQARSHTHTHSLSLTAQSNRWPPSPALHRFGSSDIHNFLPECFVGNQMSPSPAQRKFKAPFFLSKARLTEVAYRCQVTGGKEKKWHLRGKSATSQAVERHQIMERAMEKPTTCFL